jgi:RHH-type rel operon transcriptional repressor/antitoxin RelB
MNLSLSPQLENRLSILAQELGKKENELIEEALISYLEDLEDIKDAEYRLSNPDSYLTIDELEKSLELED